MEENPSALVPSNQQNQNRNSGQYVNCNICKRAFKTNRGLQQHLSFCRKINDSNNIAATSDKSDSHDSNGNGNYETYFWNDVRGTVFEKDLTDAHEKIVHWKRNLFMMSSGAAGKNFIDKVTRLLKLLIQESPLKSIALKAIHVMPAFLLQKPSKNSKSKDHLVSLERRLKLWEEGDLRNLLHERETILERMKINEKGMNIEKISLKFKNKMSKGNVNGALNPLTENMSNGILPLNDKTLTMLKQKHPEANELPQEVLLQGRTRPVHPIVYEDMDESLILKAAMVKKGGSGPSGLDGLRKILTSQSFGTASSELRKTFALFVKSLCVEEIKNVESLESFIACRLIRLDKRPGISSVGVGEVLRRIAGKTVMILLKKDVLQAAGSLQLCGGQVAGSEAAIHAMHDVFNDDNTEGILLIDAENAFNSIN